MVEAHSWFGETEFECFFWFLTETTAGWTNTDIWHQSLHLWSACLFLKLERLAYWAIFCSMCGHLFWRCLWELMSERCATKWSHESPAGDVLFFVNFHSLMSGGMCDGACQAVFSRRAETVWLPDFLKVLKSWSRWSSFHKILTWGIHSSLVLAHWVWFTCGKLSFKFFSFGNYQWSCWFQLYHGGWD